MTRTGAASNPEYEIEFQNNLPDISERNAIIELFQALDPDQQLGILTRYQELYQEQNLEPVEVAVSIILQSENELGAILLDALSHDVQAIINFWKEVLKSSKTKPYQLTATRPKD